jgi:hypothetical protein
MLGGLLRSWAYGDESDAGAILIPDAFNAY